MRENVPETKKDNNCCNFNDRIQNRYGLLAVSTFAKKQDPGNNGNLVIPGNGAFAVWAK